MALKTKVYISNVTNLTEARYYAGMEVSIIGFNATPDATSFTTSTQFDAITSWLSGAKIAWQWHLPISQTFIDLCSESKHDFIEITLIPEIQTLNKINKPILLRTKDLQEVSRITPDIEKYLEAIVWEGDLETLPSLKNIPIYIQSPSSLNAEEFALTNPEIGIALDGIPESRPGWNNFDQMADLLESLEIS